MQIPFINKIQALLPSNVPLDKLAGNPNLSEIQKIGEVARQFESLLLRQMLGEVSKPAGSGNNVASGIYNDMLNSQMADTVSRSGHLGLANALKGQLSHQVLKTEHLPSKILPSVTNSN